MESNPPKSPFRKGGDRTLPVSRLSGGFDIFPPDIGDPQGRRSVGRGEIQKGVTILIYRSMIETPAGLPLTRENFPEVRR